MKSYPIMQIRNLEVKKKNFFLASRKRFLCRLSFITVGSFVIYVVGIARSILVLQMSAAVYWHNGLLHSVNRTLLIFQLLREYYARTKSPVEFVSRYLLFKVCLSGVLSPPPPPPPPGLIHESLIAFLHRLRV